MFSYLREISILAVTLCMLSPVVYSQSLRQERGRVVPGVLIVRFESDMNKSALPSILEVKTVEPAFPFIDDVAGKRTLPTSVQSLQNRYRVWYSANLSPKEAARLVSNQSGVVYAEPWYKRSRRGWPSAPGKVKLLSEHVEAIPNDPLFTNQEYMNRMQFPKAWDIVKGKDGDVVIAVVDLGTDWKHPDLRPNVWTNPGEVMGNGIDDDQNGFVDDVHGWNFTYRTPDPSGSGDFGNHGTAVAGIATAVTHNSMGIAGASWNAKFMPLNVGCEDHDEGDYCFSNEGVLYAAMNGADIINCSFGSDEFFLTEADVMQAAQDLGALVLAAPPNELVQIGAFLDYPSSLPTTLSVSGLHRDSDRIEFAYGYTVDIFAPAVDILGTSSNGTHDQLSGTSYATPLVAGVAALVKTAFPDFTHQQIREQLQATADNIDVANPSAHAGLFGSGRVNAYRAVTERDAVSVRMTDVEFMDSNGDGRYDAGEKITMRANFTSHLADTEGLNIEFKGNTPHLIFGPDAITSTGPVQSGDSFSRTVTFTPTEHIPYRSLTFIRSHMQTHSGLDISNTGHAGRLMIRDAQVAEHKTRTLEFSMTSEGNIGYVDFSWVEETEYPWNIGTFGLIDLSKPINQFDELPYKYAAQEMGLVVGMDMARVSGSVLEPYNPNEHFSFQNLDFEPITPLEFIVSGDGRQKSRVVMQDSKERLTLGLEIVQESLVDPDEFYEDVAIVRYRFVNPTNIFMENLYAGIYFDIELHDWSANLVGYDDIEGITYTRPSESEHPSKSMQFLGLAILSEDADKHSRSYTWDESNYLYTPSHLWEGLSGGITYPREKEDQWSQIVASGPHAIAAMSEVVVDFAIVYGEGLVDLQENVRRARQLKDSWEIEPTEIAGDALSGLPESFVLHGNYPNPFTRSTKILFDLPAPAYISASVIDVLGRVVRVNPAQEFTAGRGHVLDLNIEELASGIYLYGLHINMEGQTLIQYGTMSLLR